MPASKGTVPWNAGTSKGWVDKRGYRWVYVYESGRRRARREHRVIMAAHLGRDLEPWEVVHHKDGNPSNNEISNLELMQFGSHTTEHHAGSRKSYEARRTMEAFALLREEVKHQRLINADLLAALKDLLDEAEDVFVCMADATGIDRHNYPRPFTVAREVIAKAEGRS